jgi:hypothetical protein
MKDKTTKELYERYVTDLDTSERLKAIGWNYPTLFHWSANPTLDVLMLHRTGVDLDYQGPREHIFAAPTAMELHEQLPDEIWITLKNRSIQRQRGVFYFVKHNGKYVVSLMVKGESGQLYEFHREEDTSEANACGAMYAYIFENHLNELHVR